MAETLEEYFRKKLFDNFLLEGQVDEVMERVKARYEMRTVQWKRAAAGYTATAMAVIWYAIKIEALAWIDETMPKAFFRNMFIE